MSDIDKDIEILKEIQEDLNKDVYMEKNNLIRKEKWREQAQAIENVLLELEIKETNIRFSNKVIEDLSIDMDYLKAELETWKKIAEKLAKELVELVKLQAEEKDIDLKEEFKDEIDIKETIIDWARNEVEKDE